MYKLIKPIPKLGFLFCFLAILGFMPLILGPGLSSPQPIAKYLNGNLPQLTPGDGQNIAWSVVPAYPNLTFNDPLVIKPHPRENLLFVASRQGFIEYFDNTQDVTTKTTFADLTNDVAVVWDGGFLGMAFHPDFGLATSPNRNYVYMYYTAKGPNGEQGPFDCDNTCFSCENNGNFFGSYLRLSRFSVIDGTLTLDPNSELRLFNIRQYNGTHRGGGLNFGNDGFLYLAIGDQARRTTAQGIVNNFEGGIIRIDVNQAGGNISHAPRRKMGIHTGSSDEFTGVGYYIPTDNPWLDTNNGLFEEFVQTGHRNPHRMTKDRSTGDFWIGEVGAGSREEISILQIGYNGGWPIYEGNLFREFTDCNSNNLAMGLGTYNPPVVDFLRSEANAIIGGYVYRGSKFPSLFGKYICGGYSQKRLFAIESDANGTYSKTHFGDFTPGSLITFGEGPDGELYMGRQASNTTLYTLQASGSNPPAPALLSQTGAFSNLANLTPSQGVLPYDMIEPFWSDGADKKRWMSIPNNGTHNTSTEQIQFSADGNWEFPRGAVLIKHFELGGKRLETRFEVKGEDDVYYYLTYKWNDAQTDAELLETSLDEVVMVNGMPQTWHYPSRSECLNCHLTEVGSVLGPKTKHLNKNITYPSTGINANQLVTLSHLGILNESITDANSSNYMAVAAKDDVTASLEYRARTYLDVNCSNCHQPATANRAQFDARITTPLAEQNLINGAVIYDLGLDDPRAIIPQDVTHSMIHHRMNSLQVGAAMPPLAKNKTDDEGLQLIADWINSLSPMATQDLVTTGDAAQLDGGCYEITPNTSNQAGSAWYPNSVNFSQDVQISFSVQFGNIEAGADGVALVFQNQGTNVDADADGSDLGASGISPSLAIEFDTEDNGGTDISNDHIAIWQNGNRDNILLSALCATSNCDNIEDGQIHIIKIKWSATLKSLTVFFNDEQRVVYTDNFINSIFNGNNNLFVGVTSGTGTLAAQHTVCGFYVDAAANNNAPQAAISATPISGTAPLNVNFNASNSMDVDGDDLSYSWDFGDNTTGSGLTTNNTYITPGTYTATLTVSDGQLSDATTVTITVNNAPSNSLVSFSDQTALLLQANYSGVAMAVVDMNGDKKDDIVRFNQAKELNIKYQTNAGQNFGSYNYGSVSNARQWSTTVADVDQNGYNDILSGGAYDNVKIYRNNNGNNSYTLENIPNSNQFIQGSNFVDINNDGWVDIFACHDDAESRPYQNNQDGTFTYNGNLIATPTSPTSDNSGNYASIWTDYDNDGDLDLYISKCRIGVSSPTDPRRINMLWQNDGNNNFTEVSAAANLKIGAQSWLSDFADIDNDGDLDCIVVNHYEDNQLMRNNGNGTFTDITSGSGLLPTLAGSNAFGIQAFFRDFNNDGFVDLIFTGTKHFVFYNNGNGSFTEAPNPFNSNQIESLALGDLNHDGFIDVYAGYANLFTTPSNKQDRLFINNGNSNNFLNIQLEGTLSNINAIGARVEIYGAWGMQIREVRSGEGYGIMNSFTQHFGIGTANQVDKVIVRWPSGIVQEINNPSINQFLTIIENSGCVVGNSCNDGDVCTTNDVYDANCDCVGTFQDSDNDGICDANDSTNGNCTLGAACNDNDDCTNNDVYDANCNCAGTLIDSNNNGICDTEETDCTGTQYPYECVTTTIPGLVQAERYDEGGEGIAYHDDNTRNGSTSYRPNDNVDVTGNVVGWIKNGEWLEYTLDVTQGTYSIQLLAASNSSNPGSVDLSIDGNSLINIDIQNTGGWGSASYQNFTSPNVYIAGGTKVLRLDIIGGSFNLDHIQFTAETANCTPGSACNDSDDCTENDVYDNNCNCAGTLLDVNNNGICDNDETADCTGVQYPFECVTTTIPGLVQAERYDEGGEGIAYHDDNIRDGNTSFRPNDNVDVSGGAVGWIKNGEWLEYTLDGTAGTYSIKVLATSNSSNPGSIDLSIDGSNLANIDIQNTGGWGSASYQNFTASNIYIPGGTKVLRLDMLGGSFNLDQIEFVLETAGCVTGSPCNDNDACTNNDVYDSNCNCVGTLIDINNNGICDSEETDCTGVQYPYECTTITIPTTVQAERYDEGGEGIAYHDDNTRNGSTTYRPADNVDVVGNVVGWIQNGEWLEYTLDVTQGNYTIHIFATSNSSSPGDVSVSLEGNQLATIDVENTGGWGSASYQNFSATNVFMAGGIQKVIRLDMIGGSFNIDYIEFVLESTSCTVGAACNDNDVCTINDVFDANCNCVGTFQDSDGDGICDANDNSNGNCTVGASCNDNDVCTTNDVYDADCNCSGTFQDSDSDGTCDANDPCPNDPTNACNNINYCTLVGANSNFEFIQKVVFGSINNDSGNDGGYGDFTSMSTSVAVGQSLSIELTPGFASATMYNEAFVVWIDYNADGDFTDSGEMVFTGSGNQMISGTITIPSNIANTTTRMRVAMQWNSVPSDPCGSLSYGEVEDYTIIISGVSLNPSPASMLMRPIGTTNDLAPQITVFPNPTRNDLTIQLDQAVESGQLEFYNNMGELVRTIYLKGQYQINLQVKDLAAGIYIARLALPNGAFTVERFIKVE